MGTKTGETSTKLHAPATLACSAGVLILLLSQNVCAQTNSYLDSTRPTISSDAAIQQKGVLQIESGYDNYFLPFDQTGASSFYYSLTNWLRLDATVSFWRATDVSVSDRTIGVGTSAFGAKMILFHEGRSRIVPGLAVEYKETLATASRSALQSRYHQGTLILSNSYGPWRWKLNGSAIGSGCDGSNGCSVHSQIAFGVSEDLTKAVTAYTEFFGQSDSASAPAGVYAFVGASRLFNKHALLNGGLRFGITPAAPTVGVTVGVTFAVGGRAPDR